MISKFINRIFIGIKQESAILSRRWFYIPSLFTIFLILLASRRWMQLIIPQVWDEDGTQIIPGFITHGWASLFTPVNGYLIMVPKLISAISLTISFSHYPIISTIIVWLFIASIGLAIVLSPTSLKGKLSCAILMLSIPSDPEVFGLPLYTFWWSSILLFLVSLWNEKNQTLGWRLAFLLIGGLSSPMIVLILPILYLRVYWYRSLRSEWVVALGGTIIAFVQTLFIVTGSAGQFPLLGSVLKNVIPVFFGNFLIGNWFNASFALWLTGILLIGFIIAWFLRNQRNLKVLILLYLLLGSIVMTIARVDPAIIHPKLAGPRYFFFPFILLFWVLIQGYYASRLKIGRIFISIIVVIAVINAIPVWSRQHDDLRWADHVRSCRLFPSYTIPIQTDGNRSSAWPLELSGKNCTDLLKHNFLASINKNTKNSTYPYVVKHTEYGKKPATQITNNTTKVIDSRADTGEITLKLQRGDSILYHSEPSKVEQSVAIIGHESEFITELPSSRDWVALEFSNNKLPDKFVVKVKN